MTTFKGPLTVGTATGEVATDTQGYTVLCKSAGVSANGRSFTRLLEPGDNEIISYTVTVVVPVSGSGLAAGVNIRLGDSTSSSKFGTVSVSASGSYTGTLRGASTSAGTELIVDATAQGSAADWEELNARVHIRYVSRG